MSPLVCFLMIAAAAAVSFIAGRLTARRRECELIFLADAGRELDSGAQPRDKE